MLWNLFLNHAFSYFTDHVWSTGGRCDELNLFLCYSFDF